MRAIAVLSAFGLLLAAGSAWACPMQSVSASNGQTVASSGNGSSTPIPARSKQGTNG